STPALTSSRTQREIPKSRQAARYETANPNCNSLGLLKGTTLLILACSIARSMLSCESGADRTISTARRRSPRSSSPPGPRANGSNGSFTVDLLANGAQQRLQLGSCLVQGCRHCSPGNSE